MDFAEILSFITNVLSQAWNIQSTMFQQAGALFIATFIGLFVTYTIVRFFISRALSDFGSSDSVQPESRSNRVYKYWDNHLSR